MSDAYLVGQVVRISADIHDENGLLADPGSLALKTRVGSGQIRAYAYGAAPELVRDSVGVFHADLPLTESGQMFYRWETDAPNKGAAEGRIIISEGRFS